MRVFPRTCPGFDDNDDDDEHDVDEHHDVEALAVTNGLLRSRLCATL